MKNLSGITGRPMTFQHIPFICIHRDCIIHVMLLTSFPPDVDLPLLLSLWVAFLSGAHLRNSIVLSDLLIATDAPVEDAIERRLSPSRCKAVVETLSALSLTPHLQQNQIVKIKAYCLKYFIFYK